ncbi:MAG: MATE family efflux transporter [Akkermansia sp.]
MAENDKMFALGHAPIGKLLLRYSLPAIAGMVVFSLYNIIDSVFIGHGIGPLAISGLAVAFPMMNLVFAFSLLIGIGGASVSSLRMGAKDIEGAFRVLGNVVVLNIIVAIGFGWLSFYFLDEILIAFGASAESLPYGRDFMQIILLGLPVTYMMFNLNHIMRATGYPQKAMISSIVTVVINVILAPIFIFWLEWGTRGAAVATVIAQLCGLWWVLHHFMNQSSTIHFKRGIYQWRGKIIKNILAIGMSPFFMNICGCSVVVVLNAGLKNYGGDMAIGAFGIINRVLSLFVMVVIGLTQGMQAIIGFNYGAKNFARVKQTLTYGLIAAASFMALGTLIAEVFPRQIAEIFTDDSELIQFSVTGLRFTMIVFPIVGCQIVIQNFFQAIGKAKISIFLSTTRQLLLLIPCLLILQYFWGLTGIWISIPLTDFLAFTLAASVLIIFFKKMNSVQIVTERE